MTAEHRSFRSLFVYVKIGLRCAGELFITENESFFSDLYAVICMQFYVRT